MIEDMVAQVRAEGRSDSSGGNGHGERWEDPGWTLEVDSIGRGNGLAVEGLGTKGL